MCPCYEPLFLFWESPDSSAGPHIKSRADLIDYKLIILIVFPDQELWLIGFLWKQDLYAFLCPDSNTSIEAVHYLTYHVLIELLDVFSSRNLLLDFKTTYLTTPFVYEAPYPIYFP